MQVLYVVELTIRPREPHYDEYTTAVGGIASWLSSLAGEDVDAVSFAASGVRELRPYRAGVARTARWELVGADDPRALRIEVVDTDDASGSVFLNRLTLGRIASRTTVRVSMARGSSPTWLSPSPPADLRQPGVVRRLLDSDQIDLFIHEQLQDGRYIQVRLNHEIEVLVEALRGSKRLPILLVHTRTLPANEVALEVARKLVGLVRVVTLDYRASRALDARLPGYAPPYAGARLVWSDPTAPTVPFDESMVNDATSDVMRARLMRIIAPLSVLARGTDDAYAAARREAIRRRDDETRTRSEHARSQGNASEQIAALSDELTAAQDAAKEWERLAVEESERADRFQLDGERVPALEAQVEQLTVALQASPDTVSASRAADQWSTLPGLVTSDSASAEDLFNYLAEISESRIAFTSRAASSWKKSRYPYPEEMGEALVRLAKAASTLYDGVERTIPHLDTWIRTEFNLKVALQDDTIEKNSKLRNFEFEDRTYDRTPHVKVRDHTAPSQVGRVHFALDTECGRFIVDHVGVKLY